MGMVSEFKEFIARGNVLDLAVGVVIGAAFGKIVTAMVDGIVMPIVGVALGGVRLFVTLLGQVVERLARVTGPRRADAVGREHGGVPVLLVREVRAPAEEEQLR